MTGITVVAVIAVVFIFSVVLASLIKYFIEWIWRII